jgi:hypothetical protein
MTNPSLRPWIAYAMKMECRRCGDQIFADEDDAEAFVQDAIDEGAEKPPDLRRAGRSYCDYCNHLLDKND